MNYQLIQGNDPALTTVALNVPHGEDVIQLIEGMFQVMYKGNGIGLAANQVGALDRVIVIDVRGLKHAIINPIITKKSLQKGSSVEGCLSFPNKIVKKKRYKRVTIDGFDENWSAVKLKLNGLASYCVQHEIDHLNGITIKGSAS